MEPVKVEKVVTSEKGKDLLVINGFKFRFQKMLANNMERWCCTKTRCKSYIKCNDTREVFGGNLQHNHDETDFHQQMLNASLRRTKEECNLWDSAKVFKRRILRTLLQGSNTSTSVDLSFGEVHSENPTPSTESQRNPRNINTCNKIYHRNSPGSSRSDNSCTYLVDYGFQVPNKRKEVRRVKTVTVGNNARDYSDYRSPLDVENSSVSINPALEDYSLESFVDYLFHTSGVLQTPKTKCIDKDMLDHSNDRPREESAVSEILPNMPADWESHEETPSQLYDGPHTSDTEEADSKLLLDMSLVDSEQAKDDDYEDRSYEDVKYSTLVAQGSELPQPSELPEIPRTSPAQTEVREEPDINRNQSILEAGKSSHVRIVCAPDLSPLKSPLPSQDPLALSASSSSAQTSSVRVTRLQSATKSVSLVHNPEPPAAKDGLTIEYFGGEPETVTGNEVEYREEEHQDERNIEKVLLRLRAEKLLLEMDKLKQERFKMEAEKHNIKLRNQILSLRIQLATPLGESALSRQSTETLSSSAVTSTAPEQRGSLSTSKPLHQISESFAVPSSIRHVVPSHSVPTTASSETSSAKLSCNPKNSCPKQAVKKPRHNERSACLVPAKAQNIEVAVHSSDYKMDSEVTVKSEIIEDCADSVEQRETGFTLKEDMVHGTFGGASGTRERIRRDGHRPVSELAENLVSCAYGRWSGSVDEHQETVDVRRGRNDDVATAGMLPSKRNKGSTVLDTVTVERNVSQEVYTSSGTVSRLHSGDNVKPFSDVSCETSEMCGSSGNTFLDSRNLDKSSSRGDDEYGDIPTGDLDPEEQVIFAKRRKLTCSSQD